MSGGCHALVTANIEINASNFAYFDTLIQTNDKSQEIFEHYPFCEYEEFEDLRD